METLLKNNFTAFYNLQPSLVKNISAQTNVSLFELKDDNILIYYNLGGGVAKYQNSSNLNIFVINYEAFINSLSHIFKQNREKCDLIVYSDNNQYFLLNELTDTISQYVNPFTNSKGFQLGKRNKATNQLLHSLIDLMNVASINHYINTFRIKRCCFFNKQSNAPISLSATTAFNRISTIAPDGFKIQNNEIESRGFELYEYSGNQTFSL